MRLRLATFNLENLGDGPDFALRAALLRPQLLRLRADILCLQEVDGQKTGKNRRDFLALERLLGETPYGGFHRAGTHREDGPGHALDVHNLVVLSRWPLRARQIWHARVPPSRHALVTMDAPEQVLRFDRPLLAAEIALPGGRTLHVVNAHLRATLAAALPGAKRGPFAWKSSAQWAEGFYLSALKRTGQALELRLEVEALFDADPAAWIAVAGDLNAGDGETSHRLVVAGEDDTGAGDLAPRALAPVARSLPASNRFTVLHHGRPGQLDHILVSRPLFGFFRGAEAHNETLGDELVAYGRIDNPPASYHAPLVAEFELPPEGAGP